MRAENPLFICKEKIMLTQFSRTELLLGKEVMEKLKLRVAIFRVGGVGGCCSSFS